MSKKQQATYFVIDSSFDYDLGKSGLEAFESYTGFIYSAGYEIMDEFAALTIWKLIERIHAVYPGVTEIAQHPKLAQPGIIYHCCSELGLENCVSCREKASK